MGTIRDALIAELGHVESQPNVDKDRADQIRVEIDKQPKPEASEVEEAPVEAAPEPVVEEAVKPEVETAAPRRGRKKP